VDIKTCGDGVEQSSPELLAATANAEESSVEEIDVSSTQMSTEKGSHSRAHQLMRQASAVRELARHESTRDSKVGFHIAESLRQAEEAMKRVLQAKSSMGHSSTATNHASSLDKSEWSCSADHKTAAIMMSGAQPCAATATFQADGGLGVFGSLGGSFSLAQPKEELDSRCRIKFRSASVEKFAQVMMGLSQQVRSCAALVDENEESLETMKTLNMHSTKVAAAQKAEEANAEASDPKLYSAATSYRSAAQELYSAQQELESQRLLSKKTAKEQEALASKDSEDNADVQRLGKEAQELVDSARAEVHASETKVSQLTTKVAELRVTYLHETINVAK
jgi:hypothetical protein